MPTFFAKNKWKNILLRGDMLQDERWKIFSGAKFL
jgi:hypothetical protein